MEIANFKYSVIIPYGKKQGNFLRCIKSVIEQTILPTQIIVVCNGEISIDFIRTNSDIEILLNNSIISFIFPIGCTNANMARNHGLSMVTAGWTAFLDSDDWWDENWVFNVNKAINLEQSDFLYGSLRIHGKNNSQSELLCNHYSEQKTPENYLLAYKPAQTSTYFIKTYLAKEVGWNNKLRRHQDYDFFVRATKASSKTSIVNGIFVNVDWTTPRRHKFHMDCLEVVTLWHMNVEKKYFLRHLKNLYKSAFLSKDWKAFFVILNEYFSYSFKNKVYLIEQ